MSRHSIAATALVLLLVAGSAIRTSLDAQEGAARFDVASIRENRSGDRSSRFETAGDTFTATNMPVRALIALAYRLQAFEIVGGPAWIETTRFDVVAKFARDSAPARVDNQPVEQVMLRALLAERFKLSVHRETRELPVFALVLARPDRRLGPNARAAADSCDTPAGPGNAASAAGAQEVRCGMRTGYGAFLGRAIPMSAFVQMFARQTQRIIVDRTGLTGRWDLDLKWMPDEPPRAGRDSAAPDPNAPSMFTALEEQLGLRLEAVRAPVDVWIVDRVEPPVEN